jgi:hypothetical protein
MREQKSESIIAIDNRKKQAVFYNGMVAEGYQTYRRWIKPLGKESLRHSRAAVVGFLEALHEDIKLLPPKSVAWRDAEALVDLLRKIGIVDEPGEEQESG